MLDYRFGTRPEHVTFVTLTLPTPIWPSDGFLSVKVGEA